MLGRHTPLYVLYFKLLPGISIFRLPARGIVFVVFSISILAGFGVHHLSMTSLSKKQHLLMLILSFFLLLCLFVGAKIFGIPLLSDKILLAFVLLFCSIMILNLVRFSAFRKICPLAVIPFLFFDFYINNFNHIPALLQNQLLDKLYYEELIDNNQDFFRINMPWKITQRSTGFEYFGANGYTPIAIGSFYKFIHKVAGVNVPLIRRHTLSSLLFKKENAFSSKILCIKYALVKNNSEYQLLKAKKVMPHAVLVRNAVVLSELDDHLKYIKKQNFNPEQVVLLEADQLKKYNISVFKKEKDLAEDDSVSIVKYSPNRIELRTDSKQHTFLVLSELFYPGWNAYIDKKEVPILRADYLLRALSLAPGKHDVVFVYRPLTFFIGAIISIITVVFSILFIIYKKK